MLECCGAWSAGSRATRLPRDSGTRSSGGAPSAHLHRKPARWTLLPRRDQPEHILADRLERDRSRRAHVVEELAASSSDRSWVTLDERVAELEAVLAGKQAPPAEWSRIRAWAVRDQLLG